MPTPADLSVPTPIDRTQLASSPEEGKSPESPTAEGSGEESFEQMVADRLAGAGETADTSEEQQQGLTEALALPSVIDPSAPAGNDLPPAMLASLSTPAVPAGDGSEQSLPGLRMQGIDRAPGVSGDGSEELLPGVGMQGFDRAAGSAGTGAVDLALAKGLTALAEQRLTGIGSDPGGTTTAGSVQPSPPPAGLVQGPVQATAPLTQAATAVLPGLDRPVGDPGWGQQLGDRIQWMLGRDVQAAELRIHPRHLGPIELRVTVQQDQTSVTLISQHGAVREAMEAALPRLRDMLVEQGMQHVDVNVSQHSFAEQRERRERNAEDGESPSVSEGAASAHDGAEGERVLSAGVPRAVDLYV